MTVSQSSAEKEQLVIVSEILEDFYVMVHGDHFHVEEGFVPYEAKFTEETVVPKDYKLDKKDVLYQVEHGAIVKLEDGCFYYPDGKEGRKAIVTLAEAKKMTANLELDEDEHHHHHAHSHGDKKSKASKKKEVAGVTKKTDDGFILESESQITQKTDKGIVVDHNGHTHVLPTEQVKNSKWAYLLDETPSQVEEVKVTLVDKLDYISKAKEVDCDKLEVVETEEGLAIRYPHKDHHHTILVEDVDVTVPIISKELDAKLDYIAKEKNVKKSDLDLIETEKGQAIRYPHKDHHHTILVADIPKQYSLEEKMDYLAKAHGVERSQLQLTDTAQGQAVIYPHGDHFHTVLLSEVDPSLDPEDPHVKDRIGMNTLKTLGFDDEIIEDLLHATSAHPFPSKEKDPEKMKEWLAIVTALNIGQRTNPLTRPGLQYLSNLEVLGAGFTPISDLSPLYQFSNLKQVWLTQTGVKDYSFMDHLPKLEGIDLSQNGVTDLSFLSKYPQLRVLAAAGNELTDVSFLSNLPALTSLNLDHNKISDLTPLASLSHLRALSMENNAIRSLLPLKSPVLERLYVSENAGLNLTTLSSDHLEVLQAREANVTNLDFLKSNPNLKDVNLSSNQLISLASVEEAKQLECLNVSDNQIKEIGLEKEQDSLKQLDLSNNQLTSLEGVQSFTSLEELDVHHNNLTDLELSNPAESVEILDASENHLKEEELKLNQNGIPEAVAKNYPNVIAGSVADQN